MLVEGSVCMCNVSVRIYHGSEGIIQLEIKDLPWFAAFVHFTREVGNDFNENVRLPAQAFTLQQ